VYNPDPGNVSPLVSNNEQLKTARNRDFDKDPYPGEGKKEQQKFRDELASVGIGWVNLKNMIDRYVQLCKSRKIALIIYGHGIVAPKGGGLALPITKDEAARQVGDGQGNNTVGVHGEPLFPAAGGMKPAIEDPVFTFDEALGGVYALHTRACFTGGKSFDLQGFSDMLKIPVTGYEGFYKNSGNETLPDTAIPKEAKLDPVK
jgi:hypothetical protein